MNKGIAMVAVAGVACAFAGGAYFYAQKTGQDRAEAAVAEFEYQVREQFKDAAITHGKVSVDVLGGTMNVRDFKLTSTVGGQTISAGSVTLAGNEKTLDNAVVEKFVFESPAEKISVTLERLDVGDLDISNVASVGDVMSDDFGAFFGNLTLGNLAAAKLEFRRDREAIGFAEFRIGGANQGIADTLTVKGVRFTSPEGKVSEIGLESIEARNLDFGTAAVGGFEQALTDLLGIKELAASGLYFVPNGAGKRMGIETLAMQDVTHDDGLVTGARMRIESRDIPVALIVAEDPDVAALLKGFTRKSVSMRLDSKHALDLKAGKLTQDLEFGITGLGRIGATIEIAGDGALMRSVAKGEDPSFKAVDTFTIVNASLKYDDEELADRIIENLAGGDRKGFAEQTAASAGMMMGQDEKAAKMVSEAVQEFLTGGDKFEISARPAMPFAIGKFIPALVQGTLVEEMNITVAGH